MHTFSVQTGIWKYKQRDRCRLFQGWILVTFSVQKHENKKIAEELCDHDHMAEFRGILNVHAF